jgi:hypothetical protein
MFELMLLLYSQLMNVFLSFFSFLSGVNGSPGVPAPRFSSLVTSTYTLIKLTHDMQNVNLVSGALFTHEHDDGASYLTEVYGGWVSILLVSWLNSQRAIVMLKYLSLHPLHLAANFLQCASVSFCGSVMEWYFASRIVHLREMHHALHHSFPLQVLSSRRFRAACVWIRRERIDG